MLRSGIEAREIEGKALEEVALKGELFALVDATDRPVIPHLLRRLGPEAGCPLLSRHLEEEPEAPVLIHALPSTLTWLTQALAGEEFGYFLVCDLPLLDLRRHLRRWVFVRAPDGQRMEFRFDDPRVLAAFLQGGAPGDVHAFLAPCSGIAIPLPGEAIWLHERPAVPAVSPVATGLLHRLHPQTMDAMAAFAREMHHGYVADRLRQAFPEIWALRPREELDLHVRRGVLRCARDYLVTTIEGVLAILAWEATPMDEEEERWAQAVLRDPRRSEAQKLRAIGEVRGGAGSPELRRRRADPRRVRDEVDEEAAVEIDEAEYLTEAELQQRLDDEFWAAR